MNAKHVNLKLLTAKLNFVKLNSVGRGSQYYTLQLNIFYFIYGLTKS